MSDGVPEPPALDPTELAGRKFGKARKGYEQAEVRSALGLAADALRVWQERDERLQARIDQLEAALEAANVLDDERVASLLGTEAVKVIKAAREAADEIRRRAESDAEDAAAALRNELDAEAELARSETEQLRAEVLKAAEAELASARRRGREMVGEARAVRERMLRDLAERRRTARQQIAAAQAGRDQILEALRAAGVAVDGVTLNLGDVDKAVARAAERAALSVDDDIDRFVDTLRERLGDTGEPAPGELADVTVLEVVATSADGPDDIGEPDEPTGDTDVDVTLEPAASAEAAASSDDVVPAATGAASDHGASLAAVDDIPSPDGHLADLPDDDHVVVELVVPDNGDDRDDETDEPEVVGDLALASSPSELAAARRTVGADAEVIEFATATRRPASFFVGDDEDLDEDYDDLDDSYDDYEFEDDLDEEPDDEGAALTVVEGTPDDAAVAAATVHDLITRMRESTDHAPEVAGQAEATTVETTAPVEVDDAPSSPARDDESLRDRRDAAVEPTVKAVSKVLKRSVSDEQNEVLDQLRRSAGRGRGASPSTDALLGTAEADRATYLNLLLPEVLPAATAGVAFWTELVPSAGTPDLDAAAVDAVVSGPLADALAVRRVRIAKVLEAAEVEQLDADELAARLSATYREWRTAALDELAGDLVTAAFAAGTRVAAGSGSPCRWVADHGGLPCADADDNVLADSVPCGAAFPTGDTAPPAHPGCRCLLAPAD
jgi:hypothetical protein